MNQSITPFLAWLGTWGGSGEAQDSQAVRIRCTFETVVADTALRMAFEATDLTGQTLYHGVVACLGPTPTGQLRAVALSTIHGNLLLEQTPDDEGVMALAGIAGNGNHIMVTFVPEGPDRLLFSAMWRPPEAAPDDPRLGRMTANLGKLTPMRMPPPDQRQQ
ncbi:MAG: hypothetical protein IPP14_05910 [Planctomycetes bacterium]|nr:hypothetical protein [Planctomycetota bacterium]